LLIGEQPSPDGMHMNTSGESNIDTARRVKELQKQVDDLKDIVNTLLSVICEEPDGANNVSSPNFSGQPKIDYCM
tara:strand:+ start:209 stop:433 length:225 start_codon:yes stop_codon:yes gene_type:complete